MRITGGFLKGRQISFQKNSDIRPTTDKNRSAIFSILGDEVVDADVLDVCCGTGAFGIEAISRGAKSVTFIDRDISNLQKNLELIKGFDFKIIKSDLFKSKNRLPPDSYDIIFIDPPYEKYNIENILKTFSDCLKKDGIVIIEESSRVTSVEIKPFKIIDERVYGDTKIIFYKKLDIVQYL